MRRMAVAAGALGLMCATACGGHAASPVTALPVTARPVLKATVAAGPVPKANAAPRPEPSADRVPAGSLQPSRPRSWWRPAATGPNNGPEFQWELDHPLNI